MPIFTIGFMFIGYPLGHITIKRREMIFPFLFDYFSFSFQWPIAAIPDHAPNPATDNFQFPFLFCDSHYLPEQNNGLPCPG